MSTLLRLIIVGAALLFSCASPGPTAGGGSEGEARVVCVVHTTGGVPAVNAAIRLRPGDYVTPPPSAAKALIVSADTKTDDRGRFEIAGVAPGSYCIEVNDGSSALMISFSLSTDEQRDLGSDTLRAYAGISGSIDTAGWGGQQLYAQVEGLDRLVLVNADGSFAIRSLPSGAHTIRIVAIGQSDPISSAAGIVAQPGHSEKISLTPAWRFSRRLYINTTVTGADIAQDVAGFPLLIRPFECGVNGQVICFVNSDGAPLPYEIERWDSAASVAEVWVRVDTIYGNSDTHWILMMWGNHTVTSQSSSTATFDTNDGFAGVWHFASDKPTVDATANRNNAIDSGTIAASSPIGAARSFDGTSYMYIPDTATLEPRSLTISAWVSVNDFESTPAFTKVIQKGRSGHEPTYGSYTLEFREDSTTAHADLPGFQTTNQDSTYNTATALTSVTAQKWALLTGTFDATTGAGCVYVDGTLQSTFTAPSPIDYYPDRSFPVTIGCQFGSAGSAVAPQSLFVGMIDEVRIGSTPRPAAWIKLEYESQKAGSTVVVVR